MLKHKIVIAIVIATLVAMNSAIWAGTMNLNAEANADEAIDREAVLSKMNVLPASFIVNQGQVADSSVKYVLKGTSTTVHLTDDAMVFSMSAGKEENVQTSVFTMTLAGANQTIAQASEKLPGMVNYFIGNDQSKWQTDIPTFARVNYENIYSGIDMAIWGSRSNLKYEFHVAAGTDGETIQIDYSGIEGLRLDEAGNLYIKTTAGEAIDYAPFAYQDIDGQRVEVEVSYRLIDEDSYGFAVTGDYDKTQLLVIDPQLQWSTYLGGDSSDDGRGIALDSSGNVYVAGDTSGSDSGFPVTTGGYPEGGGHGPYAFVTKFSSDGNSLVYSTVIGGSTTTYIDTCHGMDIDASGNVYITGQTKSSDFPTTTGAYDEVYDANHDVYITKLNSDGNNLLYSTFIGGDGEDRSYDIVVDSNGNIYATGYTFSTDFNTTPGAYDTGHNGERDVFVIKLSPDSDGPNDLLYSTFLGGSDWDKGTAIDVYNGDIFVGGGTLDAATDFPTTPGAYDTNHNGSYDAFVAQISPDGSDANDLVYSTFIGGEADDGTNAIFIDSSGDVYIAGHTSGDTTAPINNFPTTSGAYDESHNGGDDVFVAKLSLDGNDTNDLIYSTLIGSDGAGGEQPHDLTVLNGEAYVTGGTKSSDFPTTTLAYNDCNNGSRDVFVSVFSADGSELLYSTGIGSYGDDAGWGITTNSSGDIYVTGYAGQTDFNTTSGAYDETFNGTWDAFVFKLAPYFDNGDINPADFNNWGDVTDTWDFYMLDGSGDGYFVSKKYIKAENQLIDSHCKTNAGTLIPHYHFEDDFNSVEITAANEYWDWVFDTNGGIATRHFNASNTKDSLAYATDGQKGANHDYWVIHSETSDRMFTDDWTLRTGQYPSIAKFDRLAYEDANNIYQQATIADHIFGGVGPMRIMWKQDYSGVYKHTQSFDDSKRHCFSTHGYGNITQNDGSAPAGTWNEYLWDGADVNAFN